MKITPLDIKKQEFKKVLRGYDPVEVDSFMQVLSNEFAELIHENNDLKEQLLKFDTQLRDFKQMEKTLQQTLLQAQEASEKAAENTRRESQLIIQEAELKANQLLEKARNDVMRAKDEVATLKSKKESLISRLKVLLNSEIELIKMLELDDDDMSRDLSKGSGKESIAIDDIVNKL
jgi:cell division initiation protein